jgi:hypothetical protein
MTMVLQDLIEILGELAQIIQHCWCQFTINVGSDVHLDNCIEQLVNLLQHFYTFVLVFLDCLSILSQLS